MYSPFRAISQGSTHIHMNIPFDVCSCFALEYKTTIPGATLKTVSGLAKNKFIHRPYFDCDFEAH